MELGQGIIWMAAACILVLCIAGWRKKKEILLNFTIRLVLGIAMILITNQLLARADIHITVGLNPVSVVTAGALGVPGVVLLYGIAGCKFL